MLCSQSSKLDAEVNILLMMIYVLTITTVQMALKVENKKFLTFVVPIIPDYLYNLDQQEPNAHHVTIANQSNLLFNVRNSTSNENLNFQHDEQLPPYLPTDTIPEDIINENGRVGFLFSSKALVQLVVNPIVGLVTAKVGYILPVFFGSVVLVLASLLLAVGNTYFLLFIARSIHGVASSCIAVAGIGVVASLYPDDTDRSRVLGRVLGGAALGVLTGYPIGGLLYNVAGKITPCFLLTILAGVNSTLYYIYLHPRIESDVQPISETTCSLILDPYVSISAGAIWVSTTAMAVLEPCLPIWLVDTFDPPKWQLGTVFIPDSIGYLMGTNCCGGMACRIGRAKVTAAALLLVAISSVILPEAGEVWQLTAPHFGIGLGIGAIDAALLPLLASLLDRRHYASYGAVYALAQGAVALAYSIGPMVGGELARLIGFPWLMRMVGILNLLYCPLLWKLRYTDYETVDAMKPLVASSSVSSIQNDESSYETPKQ